MLIRKTEFTYIYAELSMMTDTIRLEQKKVCYLFPYLSSSKQQEKKKKKEYFRLKSPQISIHALVQNFFFPLEGLFVSE